MKDKKINKTGFQFKPFDSIEWNKVSEKQLSEALEKDQIETLKENKIFNTGIGTFKVD